MWARGIGPSSVRRVGHGKRRTANSDCTKDLRRNRVLEAHTSFRASLVWGYIRILRIHVDHTHSDKRCLEDCTERGLLQEVVWGVAMEHRRQGHSIMVLGIWRGVVFMTVFGRGGITGCHRRSFSFRDALVQRVHAMRAVMADNIILPFSWHEGH